jgi:hypothetical protein
MDLSIKELNELIYSLGMASTKGMMCDKKLNASLLDKLYEELNYKLKLQSDITDEVMDRLKSSAQQYGDEVRTKHIHIEEDSFKQLLSKVNKPKKLGEGTAQSVLDYVESMGSVTHKEMQEYYKSLNGSNTFAYCLKNLIIPYKNRKTQRYLIKNNIGKYEIRLANPSNWVVIEY